MVSDSMAVRSRAFSASRSMIRAALMRWNIQAFRCDPNALTAPSPHVLKMEV